MLAVMSADDGKLSLEDSPKKFLPYFTLRDPDAAAKITIRDLLAHRSA
jgi:CubicO group peptidase (beta-lactamase class C family)